jgi:microsomal dipeptidase-like Zn-dependent dipeptidase
VLKSEYLSLFRLALTIISMATLLSCTPDKSVSNSGPWINADIYSPSGGCFAVGVFNDSRFLTGTEDGTSYRFSAKTLDEANAFLLRASDLGDYLIYDSDENYLAAVTAATGENIEKWEVLRTNDKELISIPYHQKYSDAEWALESSGVSEDIYKLKHHNSGLYLSSDGLSGPNRAGLISLTPIEGCAIYPELTTDASGVPRSESWENGDVFGFADIHTHMFINEAFGGGGAFHGAPYHRLGVEHALPDCEPWHGKDGVKDIIDAAFSGQANLTFDDLLYVFTEGQISGHGHETAGYPDFIDWPNARKAKTHQAQYYKWLERAYMGGLRLIVELATGSSVYCRLIVSVGAQEAPYGCNDMVSVDHSIEAARGLERYIDAQFGGPGKGWFRIVETPEAAREVIKAGKLAVVLGIEISNLFDCFVTPPEGMPQCDEELIQSKIEEYYQKGVRVVFPIHKFDNGFGPGDGQDGPIELGNILNTGHYTNKTTDCPDIAGWDNGSLSFAGLNRPRDDYFAPPPFDMSGLEDNLLLTLAPLISGFAGGGAEGDWCQNHGLTELGRDLIRRLMARGMIIDIAHIPRWAKLDAFELFDEKRYPAISTHCEKHEGRIYKYGGNSACFNVFNGCAEVGESDTMGDRFRDMTENIRNWGGYAGQPFGIDLGGFAGARGPRFGPESGCPEPQTNPVEYPFTSYDGNVTFTQTWVGNRKIDFNTEGLVHVGMLPELIEDVRRDGMSDSDLEPLFRTAESFIRTWEAAIAASTH